LIITEVQPIVSIVTTNMLGAIADHRFLLYLRLRTKLAVNCCVINFC
jgi:hypothetical protein